MSATEHFPSDIAGLAAARPTEQVDIPDGGEYDLTIGPVAKQLGSIGLKLTAAPSVTLSSVTYTITANGFTKTGAIDTSGSPTVSGTIGGIPAGAARSRLYRGEKHSG